MLHSVCIADVEQCRIVQRCMCGKVLRSVHVADVEQYHIVLRYMCYMVLHSVRVAEVGQCYTGAILEASMSVTLCPWYRLGIMLHHARDACVK